MSRIIPIIGIAHRSRSLFPHDCSNLSHWSELLGNKLEFLLAESLRVAHASDALRTKDFARVTVDTTVQPRHFRPPSNPPRGSPAARLSAPISTRDTFVADLFRSHSQLEAEKSFLRHQTLGAWSN